MTAEDSDLTIAELRDEARAWLTENAVPRERAASVSWGEGSDSVAIFHNLTMEEELRLVEEARRWQARKFDAGYGALAWPAAYGGRGLTPRHAAAFAQEESRFETPATTELFAVTIGLIAPTIAAHGTEEQKARFIRPLLRTDLLACQLFSEPGAGSDLASVSTKAERDGDDWILTGQKVWTSGAHIAQYGECICRTDPSAPKHKGMTAFIVPLDAPGVEVRAIRQMTGGTAFNEVFLDEVRVPDALRLGDEGNGWAVALTTLANERAGGSSSGSMAGGFQRILALGHYLGRTDEPLVRQELADLYIHARVSSLNALRVQAKLRAGQTPGPEGSIGKLVWTAGMTRTANAVARLLGPRIAADTGEWGTYAWAEYLLGAPGYRIAGGSDEIQRNIIGERVLGLPKEPRADGAGRPHAGDGTRGAGR